MSDATEITNIVFSALSDRKGFDDWFDQIDQELQTEIKAEIAEAIAALRAQPDHSELVAKLQDLVDNGWIEGCKTTTRDIEEAILALT